MELPVANYKRDVESLGRRSNRAGEELLDFNLRKNKESLGYQLGAIKEAETALTNHSKVVMNQEIREINFKSDQAQRKQQLRHTIINGVLSLASQGAQMYGKYQAEKAQESFSDQNLGLAEDKLGWEEKQWDTESYDTTTLKSPYEGVTTVTNDDGSTSNVRVPKSEVYIDERHAYIVNRIEERAEFIKDPTLKRKFIVENTTKAKAEQIRDRIVFINAQRKERLSVEIAKANELHGQGKFGLSDQVIADSQLIPESMKIKMHAENAQGQEIDEFYMKLAHMSENDLRDEANRLKADDGSYNGVLDNKTRVTMAKTMEGKADQIGKERLDRIEAEQKVVNKYYEDNTDAIAGGLITDPRRISGLVREASSKGASPEVSAKIEAVAEIVTANGGLYKAPPEYREHVLGDLLKTAQDTGNWELYDTFSKAIGSFNADMKSDPYGTQARINGTVVAPLNPLDENSVLERRKQQEFLIQSQGVDVPLTRPAEQARMTHQLNESKNTNPQQFVHNIKALSSVAGGDVIKEIGQDKPEYQIISMFPDEVGVNIVLGEQQKINDKGSRPPTKILTEEIGERVGNLWQHAPSKHTSYTEALENLYSFHAVKQGKNDGQWHNSVWKSVEKDTPLLSLRYGGQEHKFWPPRPGATNVEASAKLATPHNNVFAKMNIREGHTLESQANMIRMGVQQGKIEIVQIDVGVFRYLDPYEIMRDENNTAIRDEFGDIRTTTTWLTNRDGSPVEVYWDVDYRVMSSTPLLNR